MQTTEQAIHMSCQSEAEAGMVPPVFVRFDLAAQDLTIVQDRMEGEVRQCVVPTALLHGVSGYEIPKDHMAGRAQSK